MASVGEAAEATPRASVVSDPSEPAVIAPKASVEVGTRVLPFAVALLVQVLTYWTIDGVTPALAQIKDDLALSATGAGLVFSLFFAGRLIANLPAAFLVDRIGVPPTAMVGGSLLVGGSVIAALANDALLLLTARAIQGSGVALVVTAALLSLVRTRPGEGAAMTYFGFAATLGGVFGLGTAGILTEVAGWRGIFVLSIGLGGGIIAAAFLSGRAAPALPPAPAAPERAVGFSAALPARAPGERLSKALFVVLAANLLVFFNYAVWVAVPLYADQHFNASARVISALLMTVVLMHLIAAFPAGRLIRRWGGRRALAAGLLLSMSGMALVLVPTNAIWLALPLIPYGAGQVLASNAAGDLVLRGAGRGGRAVGLVRLSSDLGLVLGPYVSGTLMDTAGYRMPFAVLPVITAVALALLWRGTGVRR